MNDAAVQHSSCNSRSDERRSMKAMTKKRWRRTEPAIVDLAADARPWLKLEPLAVYWSVEIQTLRKWIRAGKLAATRFGRVWRVKRVDAVAFEEEGRLGRA